MRNQKPRPVDPGEGVTVDGVTVSPTVSLRFFRPTDATGPVPVLLWMHGGGHLFGIHLVSGQRRDLQKRRTDIQQHIDALAWQQLTP